MQTGEQITIRTAVQKDSEILRLLVPEPGEVLDGRFLILEVLREGGTSRVLQAMDLERGDLVAVKVPKEHFAQDAEFLGRFQKEEEIGLRTRHPYLIAMRPVPGKTRPYLVMEYAKGETLAARLASGARLSVPESLRIADMLLQAVGELHGSDIVHGDVTSRNVMLCEDGSIRLLDYGIASPIGKSDGPEQWIWGTPAYMAPEQVQNHRPDRRTDLYSVGIVLYEMLTGCVPFVGDDPVEVMNARLREAPVSPRTLNPDLDPDLERVVLRALDREAKNRYPDSRTMIGALRPFVRSWLDRPTRRRRKAVWLSWLREYWAEIAAGLLLAALVGRMLLLSP
jgi:eukaryotic-like serine/threonine-protein kinase